MTGQNARPSRWPLWLWGAQLLPAALLIIFGLWRQSLRDHIEFDATTTVVALAAGLLWAAAAAVMLLLPSGRAWLLAHRRDWCLAAAVLAICLAVVDIALTQLGIVPTVEAQRDRSLVYSFGRHTVHRFVQKDVTVDEGETIHINARGFRGADVDGEKAPGKVRILFLGGSQVFGYYAGDWPAATGEKLRQAGYDVDVINAGVPGHTTFDSLGKLVTDAWTLLPDIIVLCQAWNDLKYFPRIAPDAPFRGPPPAQPITWQKDWRLYPTSLDALLVHSALYRQFRWGLASLFYYEEGARALDETRLTAISDTIGEWGPAQYRLNLILIANVAEEIGARLVLCKQARLALEDGDSDIQEFAMEYGLRTTRLTPQALIKSFGAADAIIESVADDEGAVILDMDARLSGRADYFFDAIHFNKAGGAVAAELAFEALLPLVAERAAPQATSE